MDNKIENSSSFFTKKTILKLTFSFLISIVLFYFILQYVSFTDIIYKIKQISIGTIIISCVFFLINYFFRTLRIHLLLSGRIHFFQLYVITILHNTLVQILPFRLGEFSFLYLTTKTKKVGIIDAGATLISLHLFDVIILFSGFLISFLFLDKNVHFPIPKALIFLILFFVFSMILCLLGAKRIQPSLEAYLSKKEKHMFLVSFLTKCHQLLIFLENSHSKKKLLFFYSFCVWTSYYALMYFLYSSMDLHFSYTTFLFIISTALLFALIPIQGIAGFGNVELSWGALLILFGVESTVALQTTIQIHIIGIMATLIIGLCGVVLFLLQNLYIDKKKASNYESFTH